MLDISPWFTPSVSASFAWVICRALRISSNGIEAREEIRAWLDDLAALIQGHGRRTFAET
jgi:hypothetical protein